MKTIIFPGYSPKNKDWAMQVAQNLELDHEIRPILWEHWEDKNAKFDPEEKAKKAAAVIGKGNANVIAKSIGTLVTIHLILKMPDRLEKVILCGIPSGIARRMEDEYIQALSDFPTEKIIIFQNERDPFGSFENTKKFIDLINSGIRIRKTPRSDHHYPFYEEFQKFIKKR